MDSKKRPKTVPSLTFEIVTACGPVYVTISFLKDYKPFEIFIRFGKAGGCSSAMADGIARLCSYSLRAGMPLTRAIKAFKGQSCHLGENTNCLNQIAEVLEQFEKKSKPWIKEQMIKARTV